MPTGSASVASPSSTTRDADLLLIEHMSLFVKTLLMCFLVSAIPAQGVAAATVALCGPNHHGGGSAAGKASATLTLHSHHVEPPLTHKLGFGVSTTVAFADDAPADGHGTPVAEQKCNACASCCFVGAILNTLPVVPATEPAPAMCTAVVATVDAVAPTALTAPPRNVLG